MVNEKMKMKRRVFSGHCHLEIRGARGGVPAVSVSVQTVHAGGRALPRSSEAPVKPLWCVCTLVVCPTHRETV